MNHIKRLILTGALTLTASAYADWLSDMEAPYLHAAQIAQEQENRYEMERQTAALKRQAAAMERQANALENLERSSERRSTINIDY